VHFEGPGHPGEWDRVLARRVAADSLFDLGNINLGFVRPSSGEDWALAYYQAELYTRYMEDRYGGKALGRLIAAYGDNLDTPAAIQRSFGVTLAAFEKGYRQYVAGIAGPSVAAPRVATDAEEAALQRVAEEHPGDADAWARLARAGLERGPWRARTSAEKALAIDPRQQQAAFVVAKVALREGDPARAYDVLQNAFDARRPDPEALTLLAGLTLQNKAFARAESLLTLGVQRFPGAADWDAGLVQVYREAGRREELAGVLTRRALRDPDDLGMRMELARLTLDLKQYEAAAGWAAEAIDIDVTSPDAHAMLARSLSETGRGERAIEEYEVALRLDPGKSERQLALAKACAAAGRKDRARAEVEKLLAHDPHYPGARELLDSLRR
jgi:Flp pilus assembly protein TadD